MLNYFSKPLGINTIPNFLRASTASGLRRLMAINNRKHSGFIKYFDFQYIEKEGRWYVWYFVSEELDQLAETLTGQEPQENS